MKITRLWSQEVLDSRGFPTLACFLELDGNVIVSSSVPSGASVGRDEAHELRDHDQKRYLGQGVQAAQESIDKKIAALLVGKTPDLRVLDEVMIKADGTKNKSNLGANALLATSIAVARAQAHVQGVELFQLFAKVTDNLKPQTPRCMFNLINGGMHAGNKLVIQEFMVMPVEHKSFEHTLHDVVLVYQKLKGLLTAAGLSTGLGDEGGFAPEFSGTGIIRERRALDFLMEAILQAGFTFDQMKICLDVAASTFYDPEARVYCIDDEVFSSERLIDLYQGLLNVYPIVSIEDGMDEYDHVGWKLLTEALGDRVQLVGDDLFVTSTQKILKGAEAGVANSVIIKPNQVGTISEALDACKAAKSVLYSCVASHRSGETCDDFIADFAVGAGLEMLKAGAPARGERVAKYNRLLEISRLLE